MAQSHQSTTTYPTKQAPTQPVDAGGGATTATATPPLALLALCVLLLPLPRQWGPSSSRGSRGLGHGGSIRAGGSKAAAYRDGGSSGDRLPDAAAREAAVERPIAGAEGGRLAGSIGGGSSSVGVVAAAPLLPSGPGVGAQRGGRRIGQ